MNKIKIFFVTFVWFVFTAQAETKNFNETTLPLAFNTGNTAPYGLPSTIIEIEGKSLPILVDTGDSKTEISLSPEVLKKIHVNFTEKSMCFNAFDGKHCEKQFIIPEIKLGNFVVKNVSGMVMPKLWGGHGKGFHETDASRNGVIGYPLLSKFNLLLDYPNSKMLLIKPGNQPLHDDITHWPSINFQNHLQTKLKLNGKLLTFIWDTGAIPSGISRSAAQNFQTVSCPKDNPYKGDNPCLRVESHSLTTGDNQQLPNTWFSVEDVPHQAPFDGLIGSNFYEQHLVYFDFDDHKIYVQ